MRPQTNNLVAAGATIMANSPHNTDDGTPTMPSIAGAQPYASNGGRLLYRSKKRGDSCEQTINNTIDSFLHVNANRSPATSY
jgi:hypothetical protein